MSYEPTVVWRKDWNAKKAAYANGQTQRPHSIVFHHSVTDGDADPIRTVQAIQRGHQGNGSSDIEYNWLIAQDGRIIEGRGWLARNGANGTPEQTAYGYHPELSNAETKSVCILGQFQPDAHLVDPRVPEYTPLTLEAKRAMAWMPLAFAYVFGEHPRVWGHREVRKTACPGEDVFRFVKSGLHIPLDAQPEPPAPDDPDLDLEALLPKLPELRQGDDGVPVRRLQGLLYAMGAGLDHADINGNFGPSTVKAIKKFREDRNVRNLDGTVLDYCDKGLWELLLTVEA